MVKALCDDIVNQGVKVNGVVSVKGYDYSRKFDIRVSADPSKLLSHVLMMSAM